MVDSSNVEFSDISLTPDELKALKKLSKRSIRISPNDIKKYSRLKRFAFISMELRNSGAGEIVLIRLEDRGRDYLLYTKGGEAKEKRGYSHDWKIAVFSTFAGAVLSKPLWAAFDWIIQKVSQLLR